MNPTFRNPLNTNGPDPCLTFWDGWYYLCVTTDGDIRIRRARHLADLKSAPETVVWKDQTPGRNRHFWASEFHRLESGNGPRWYLYYTASDEVDTHHRLFVLEGAGDTPLGPYTFKAKLRTDGEDAHYAIDGTVLSLPDKKLYFLWCGRPSPSGQGLYLSRMANPWTLHGERVYLPADGFGCQEVREGPEVLVRNGRVFLFYSACDTGKPDYKLGMLSAPVESDLLSPSSWKQFPQPVFARVDQWGVYGPGHCFFFQSPDGKEDWIAYHAKTTSEYTYAHRSTRVQPITWNADGTPNLGLPLSLDAEIPAPSGEPAGP